jgi:hypothetical protein
MSGGWKDDEQEIEDGGEPNGPDRYWEMSLMVVTPEGRPGPTWELSVSDETKDDITERMNQHSATFGYLPTLVFNDTKGAEHHWYGVRVIAFVENTPETRRIARTWAANGELHAEQIMKRQRRESGMEYEG